MRQRVARVALVAALVAVVLLAVPLALVIRAALFADERNELEREALAAAVRVSPQFAAGDAVELPAARDGELLGVYDTAWRRRWGTGPAAADAAVHRAATGKVAQRQSAGEIVVAVPVSDAERVIGVVRASTDTGEVWKRILLAWLALVGVALSALGVALLVARHQARALTGPLEALAATSAKVTEGDLTARAAPSGIAEIDQVGATHNDMVERLGGLLHHEREFATNASHQLRTPLTGLQLGLEAALSTSGADLRSAAREALEQSRYLQHTIDEVLRLARTGASVHDGPAVRSVGDVLEQAERRWHGPLAQDGRRLAFAPEPGTGGLGVPGRTSDQILDVLLDNARRHGRGTVRVTVRELGGVVALDVEDEGTLTLDPSALFARGTTTGQGSGIGLALAKEMAAGAGGRLGVTRDHPTTFTLLLPHQGEGPGRPS
ncbi:MULTISPECIES: sensor histidine kinase [unclassified Streptomyces]|uniref:sensor histidine kinase n=1 Tax=unclassified Streptomyces TaxID=2593676 RepID=UPI00381B177F